MRFHPASSCSVSLAVLIFDFIMFRRCPLSSLFMHSVVLAVSVVLPISLPYRNTAFIHALVMFSFMLVFMCGSRLKILVRVNDAALDLFSLFW